VNKNSVLPRLDYLLAFESTAVLGSFSAASKSLNISETAISRKVKLLELHYKTSLFTRGHRSIQITPVGQRFLEDIQPVLNQLRDLSGKLVEDALDGSVTLAATNSVAGLWLMPRLKVFTSNNSSVKIKLVSSDNDEECLSNNIDLTILRGTGDWPGFIHHFLFGETIFPVCSPDYLDKQAEAISLETLHTNSLIGVHCLHTEWMDWQTWFKMAKCPVDKIHETVVLNTYPLSIEAAVNGLGITLAWGHLAGHLLENGKLVRPLGEKSVRTQNGYYLLKSKLSSAFPERTLVEEWLVEVSASRQRYEH